MLGSNIWGNSIYILDEAKNSTCAKEMLDRGDWIVPTFNGELRTDKPPLHYYFMMAGYSIFEVNAFGARFFSVIFGILTLLITFFYTRKYLGNRTAIITVTMLLASLHFVLEFHLAVPDPYLIFFMTLAFFAFYDFYKTDRIISLIILYVSLGLGALAKGPVAIALPGLVFLLFILLRKGRQWQLIRRYKLWLAILIVAALTVPWYWLVGVKTDGAWLSGFFLEHNLDRFAETKEGHGGFFLTTLAYVFLGLLPFAVFSVQALVRNSRFLRNDDLPTYATLAGITIVIFFILSDTKLPNYTIPAYPLIAVVTAYFLVKQANQFRRWPFVVHLVIALLLPVLIYFALLYEKSLASLANHAWWFLLLPLTGIVALAAQLRKRFFAALRILFYGWATTTLLFFFVIFPKIDQKNPVNQTRQLFSLQNKNIAYFGKFNPAFSFYYHKTIPELNSAADVSLFLQNEEGVVISTKKFLPALDSVQGWKVAGVFHDLFEKPTTVILVPDGMKMSSETEAGL
jgi:4-amino-4-deoxy-L-arabinose transferase-like glycosyltransferase